MPPRLLQRQLELAADAGLRAQMRSTRNFCVDVVLICIVLAIALYIFNMVRSKKTTSR